MSIITVGIDLAKTVFAVHGVDEAGKPVLVKPKITEEANGSKAEVKSVLDELIQQGARQIIQQAVEAELASLLEQYCNVKSVDGRRAVVRNGYLPEREVITAIGPVTVQVPKVRDRSGSGIRFNDDCATVRAQVRARVGRAAVAVPAGYLDGRHERSDWLCSDGGLAKRARLR